LSRVGKVPIKIPKDVEVKIDGLVVSVKGPKGSMKQTVSNDLKIETKDGQIVFSPLCESSETKAKWGLYRVLVKNMIDGVTTGYTRELDIVGVGYKAEVKGKSLSISAGHSHPVIIEPKGGVVFTVQNASRVVVTGIDKQAVGQAAAEIRHVRPPEPYKGKGVRYVNEVVRKKAGKTGATASK
jgi:large subunit ribosomal protein L6